MINKAKPTQNASRLTHILYVLNFSVMFWLSIFIIVSCFYPQYKTQNDILRIWNRSLLYFIPLGILFGILFGVILNRWMLVSYAQLESVNVDLTWAALCGKKILGWRGVVLFSMVIAIYLMIGQLRSLYYRSIFSGEIPGLKLSQQLVVKKWTLNYFIKNPKSEAMDSINSLVWRDPDWDIHLLAVKALVIIPDSNVVDHLIVILENDTFYETRKLVAWALRNYANKESINALKRAIISEKTVISNRSSLNFQFICIHALRNIKHPDSVEALLHILKNKKSSNIRIRAVKALAEIGDTRALKPLMNIAGIQTPEDLQEHSKIKSSERCLNMLEYEALEAAKNIYKKIKILKIKNGRIQNVDSGGRP